jgi:DNA-binding response OmpR family regulator
MKRVLIIEDEQDIVDIATIILEDEGYEVSSTTEYEGFEEKIKASKADIVLLDLNLNDHHGKDICKYIKENKSLKHTWVILMSANKDIRSVKEEVGADAYLCKPFDLRDFVNTVKAHIHGPVLSVA